MCSNYRPVTRMDRLLSFFGVEYKLDRESADVFPLGEAPFIRLAVEGREGGTPALVAEDGMFGLLPHWAELKHGRKTYNARSETIARLPSFRDAWRRGQRCIIPAESIFEPCYETGIAVRWRIGQEGDVPMGIAGVYAEWRTPDGARKFTFSMLTVNADGQPLMSRMHGPSDEKRMVAILDPSEYLPWLTCPVDSAPRYFRQWSDVLVGVPDPLVRAPAVRKSLGKLDPSKPAPPPMPPMPSQGDLF